MSESTLFLRKATGLVRSWSVFDAFIYAFFSINLVTLGFYIISQMYFFKGGLIPAMIVSGIIILSEVVVYAGLIAVMPRAGGDLRVAEPHPRQRRRLRAGRHRLVVHPLAVDAAIRRHAPPHLLRAAAGGRRGEGRGAVVRQRSQRLDDRRRAHLRLRHGGDRHGHEDLRHRAEILLLGGQCRSVDRVRLPALRQQRRLQSRAGSQRHRPVWRGTRGLRRHRRRRGGRRRHHAVVRRIARRHLPRHAVPRVLQPVAQLGRDAVRRGERRGRFQEELLGHGLRADRHHRARRDLLLAGQQDRHLGLAQQGQRRLLELPLGFQRRRAALGLRLAVSGDARHVPHHQPDPAIPRPAGDEHVVLRLGRDGVPLPDAVEESKRIVAAAQERGQIMRLLGGLAVRLHSPSASHRSLARAYPDLDFAIPDKRGDKVEKLLPELGYESNKTFNLLNGDSRLLFYDNANNRQIDVFVGKFHMCHNIPITARLSLEPLTIPLAELLLAKMQIVQMNEKDVRDIFALLIDHPLGTTDDETINLPFIAQLCADDWGLWKTLQVSAQKIRDHVDAFDMEAQQKHTLVERLTALQRGLDDAPKTLKWKMRDKIGERVQWYELPEEVRRG